MICTMESEKSRSYPCLHFTHRLPHDEQWPLLSVICPRNRFVYEVFICTKKVSLFSIDPELRKIVICIVSTGKNGGGLAILRQNVINFYTM